VWTCGPYSAQRQLPHPQCRAPKSALTHGAAPCAAAIAAKKNFTDIDLIRFATNVECLEGQFDTWGVFGHGIINNLQLGGPAPLGARAANLTEATRPFLEEIALNEQVCGTAA